MAGGGLCREAFVVGLLGTTREAGPGVWDGSVDVVESRELRKGTNHTGGVAAGGGRCRNRDRGSIGDR